MRPTTSFLEIGGFIGLLSLGAVVSGVFMARAAWSPSSWPPAGVPPPGAAWQSKAKAAYAIGIGVIALIAAGE